MLTTVLRFEFGERTFDVDGFLALHPALRAGSVWRRGERGVLGRACETSGFSVDVAARAEWDEVLKDALRCLGALRDVVSAARAVGATVEVDFGVGVGDAQHFAQSVTFPVSALKALVDLGVELCVSAYPVSEA